MSTAEKRRTWTLWRPLGIGVGAAIFLILVLGVWGNFTNISGAVIGTGKVQVATQRTALQHPVGGVVAEMLVQNGDEVRVGDILLRLDATSLSSELNVVEGELFEALANEARLQAIVDDSTEILPHPTLLEAAATHPSVQSLLDRQARRLAAHYASLNTQNSLLGQQAQQVREQIIGTKAELAAKQKRKTYVEEELAQSSALAAKKLIKASVVYSLQKDKVTNEGDIARLRAKAAELGGKVAELELKRHDLAPAIKEKAVAEMSKLRPVRTKFLEKRITLLDRLSQLEIRSPIDGKIHDSQILGLRSVIVAAKPLMYIVPSHEPVSVMVRIDASDIDQIYLSQPASLKFRSFSRRTTPVIFGEITLISPDAFLDEKTKKPYYDVEIGLTPEELAKLEGKPLLPGMPVDAFISTQSRTPLNYVTKPLLNYFDRAFRDA